MGEQPYNIPTYVAGAKAALKHRGLTDYEVYYTLLAMGMPERNIAHIGKEERDKEEKKVTEKLTKQGKENERLYRQ